MAIYAHSLPGLPSSLWEPLGNHARDVADAAARLADAFGGGAMARAAGLLHDIGKCSGEFQAYLDAGDGAARGPDHSTAGAVEATRLYRGPVGCMLAFAIAGHHAGLADGTDLAERLRKVVAPYAGWQAEVGPLPAMALPRLAQSSPHRGFSLAFLIRMLFSCLVDADFVATEGFYAAAENRAVERDGFTPLAILHRRLRAFMDAKRAASEETPLNLLRSAILEAVVAKAALPPGLFTLTVPTGGGKTLASLSFALDHAVRHGLRRVVYVIPFSSIIEQTSDVFRHSLADGSDGENLTDVLEHHATFDWEALGHRGDDSGRGRDPADRLRRAAENWAAPIVVTTAVQFFESLYANRTSRCRKLHNLANSVIVLDEAQTLPRPLLRPCLAALDELQRNYGASIVLCTATQPALRRQDGFDARPPNASGVASSGLDIPEERELAPDPVNLYERTRRVKVERLKAPVTDEEIAARFVVQPQMLCIVNTRAQAQALFEAIRTLPGAVHLSTLMCPAHRRTVLAEARSRLKDGLPVRIVSTSLIEAGVDIDVPEVWRAAAGIDSIAQAAGRANREGKMPGLGRVVVFEPVEAEPPHDLKQAWEAGRDILRRFDDPLSLEAVRAYFRELYWQQGTDAFDQAKLKGETYPILERIAERASQSGETDPALAFPFASIAQAFRMIEDVMEPVVVPWAAEAGDTACETILRRIEAMDRPLGPDLRRLQQYVVGIPERARAEWLALGVLRPVHPALGNALLRFEDLSHYSGATGVRLDRVLERSALSNIMGDPPVAENIM